MKRLIVARHGMYRPDGTLNATGQEEMLQLAARLPQYIVGTVVVLTSSAPRAVNSAAFLAEQLGHTNIVKCEKLWSDILHPVDLAAAHAQIMAMQNYDTVLVVTHLEYASEYPDYFGWREFKVPIASSTLGRGQAVVIDCEARAWLELT